MTASSALSAARLELDYPISVGVYEQNGKDRQGVDHLADRGFPVGNVEIVGTDLRSIERITGRARALLAAMLRQVAI